MPSFLLSPYLELTEDDRKLGITCKIKLLTPDHEERSGMGSIADTFRRRPDVVTGEGIFRVSAWGKENEINSKGFTNLNENNGYCLLLGGYIWNKITGHTADRDFPVPPYPSNNFPAGYCLSWKRHVKLGYRQVFEKIIIQEYCKGGLYMASDMKKIAIVTGGNSGMGKATVAALADQGFTVIMVCRNRNRGEAALQELTEKESRDICLMVCDLGNMEDIRRFTNEYKIIFPRVDVLVNNAGVVSLDRRETADGLEEQFGVNHIGHFLLTLRLLDWMEEGSRIVVVASGAHKVGKIHFEDYNLTKGYNAVKAYSQSKLANILFARELADRIKYRGITVNCCHPGAVATSMGVDRNTGFGRSATALLKPFFLTPEEGAKTAVYLATSPEGGRVTGKYFYRCQIVKTSDAAKSRKAAKQLFELSEGITGEYLSDNL